MDPPDIYGGQWSSQHSSHLIPLPAAPPPQMQAMQQHIPQTPVDYRLLLLSLAEQYVSEAHRHANLVAFNQSGASAEAYCKLMASGLGCYEAILVKQRSGLHPRPEALIQLRYAKLLFESTSNYMQAEEVLSKAIPFCDRNRLPDIKYTMQHLLVRVLCKSRPKAGLKYLDGLVNDATTCQHIVWVYALRFLHVSLSLRLGTPHDVRIALQNVQHIITVAQRQGDAAVSATAALLEATIRLRFRDIESISDVQTALASARAGLMQQNEAEIPQLHILLHYLDIACSLDPFDVAQSNAKMERMQDLLDKMLDTSSTWSPDGSIPIPIKTSAGGPLTTYTDGIFTKSTDGRDRLSLAWLSKLEVYLLAFILSAAAVMNPNQTDSSRALKFLEEGLKVAEDEFQFPEASLNKGLSEACQSARWRQLAKCQLLMYKAVAKCRDSQWSEAQSSLKALLKTLESPGMDPSGDQKRSATYLTGLVLHATGNLDAALEFYNDPVLTLPSPQDKGSTYVQQELGVLAKMNTLVIIRPQTHPSHHLINTIFESLSPYFPTSNSATPTTISQNSHLVAAHAFLQTLFSSNAILDTKSHLRRSLNAAQRAMNKQLIALGSSYLYSFMFTGIVGDEAMKYARGAQATAKSARNKTWMCVSDGLLVGALELEGRWDDATAVRREAESLMQFLPDGLRHG